MTQAIVDIFDSKRQESNILRIIGKLYAETLDSIIVHGNIPLPYTTPGQCRVFFETEVVLGDSVTMSTPYTGDNLRSALGPNIKCHYKRTNGEGDGTLIVTGHKLGVEVSYPFGFNKSRLVSMRTGVIYHSDYSMSASLHVSHRGIQGCDIVSDLYRKGYIDEAPKVARGVMGGIVYMDDYPYCHPMAQQDSHHTCEGCDSTDGQVDIKALVQHPRMGELRYALENALNSYLDSNHAVALLRNKSYKSTTEIIAALKALDEFEIGHVLNLIESMHSIKDNDINPTIIMDRVIEGDDKLYIDLCEQSDNYKRLVDIAKQVN